MFFSRFYEDVVFLLSELSIRNFGIIESVDLSFGQGMTVITGETGAGKSMIMDAIGQLMGGRGSVDFVRHGAAKAEIEGLFFTENDKEVEEILGEFGIEVDEGNVILRREISSHGKSVCRINGHMLTIAALKKIGRQLIDIHGQHEHQELLQPDRHLPLLDSFGGSDFTVALQEYRDSYESYSKLEKQLHDLYEHDKDMAQRLDFLRFQVEEIDEVALEAGEDERLEAEKSQLDNYEKVYEALQEGYSALYGEQKGLEWIGRAMTELEGIANLDQGYKQMFDQIAESYYQLEELTFSLRDHFEQLQYQPGRLDELQARLADIQTLKRKYGDSVDEILRFRDQAAAEIEMAEHHDEYIEKLQQQLYEAEKHLLDKAKTLSALRKETAQKLKSAITRELKELHMAKTEFDIQFRTKEKTSDDTSQPYFQKDGIDNVTFLITTNPGEPLKPLSKVASGGELSRIMLALKSIFSREGPVTSIVFDEVDAGVSGRVAQAMAEKIFKLSEQTQVFCITHLPQVAAMADTHLYITKQEQQGRTTTSVQTLSQAEMVNEVGRMISGVEVTELTQRHAKELIQIAEEIKATP